MANARMPLTRPVARLAQRGTIAAVVTTNFDTLFERAFTNAGVAFTSYSRPQDYWANELVGLPILKIHGSARAEDGLIDTVGQKLRGLAPLVRARLSELFAAHPLLVVGFSGGDLEFGSDYLSLHSVPAGVDRLFWTTRPGDPPVSDPVLLQLVNNRGHFIPVSQADLLDALGGPGNPRMESGFARQGAGSPARTSAGAFQEGRKPQYAGVLHAAVVRDGSRLGRSGPVAAGRRSSTRAQATDNGHGRSRDACADCRRASDVRNIRATGVGLSPAPRHRGSSHASGHAFRRRRRGVLARRPRGGASVPGAR